jgi:hypothetical protein
MQGKYFEHFSQQPLSLTGLAMSSEKGKLKEG